jgi:putative copper export protein/mono/diheme cytochrome c family protein/peroxiredoxin
MSLATLGLLARWAHLGLSLAVLGSAAALLVAGRSARPTAVAWEARVLTQARALAILALGTGAVSVAYQAASLTGRLEAAFDARTLAQVLLDTQAGHVWLLRTALLLLLVGFLAFRADTRERADWLAARGQALVLATLALALITAGGHAAAVRPGGLAAMTVDAAHLVATGLWIGALLPLAFLLRAASRPDGADARPHAVLAVRRFSRLALLAVLVLAVTGAVNAMIHVASVAGLVGTTYGQILLAKLALLIPILLVATVNRRRLLPELPGEATTVGRPAMRRLAAFMAAEAALALVVLGLAAALALTPPARHLQPAWPFTFRLDLAVLDTAPQLRLQALLGSQVTVLAGVALLVALVTRAYRITALAVGTVLGAIGLTLFGSALVVDAYPTTYRRPEVPYQAASIEQGAQLYQQHCAACHGATGTGDGPAARALPRRPADLRAAHVGSHTAGDIYWWITHGIPAGGMPGFGDRLSDEERWGLVNFVRALGAADQARRLGSTVEPERRRLVAPDFAFTVGPMPVQALRDYRGRRIVLLVLYTLPGSRARLVQLARGYQLLGMLGADVIAVPRDASPAAIRQLGAETPIVFPIVTDGAREIVAAYGLFADSPHAEFLIDRQGYLRARWAEAGDPQRSINVLLADIQQLNEEPLVAAADEHVH